MLAAGRGFYPSFANWGALRGEAAIKALSYSDRCIKKKGDGDASSYSISCTFKNDSGQWQILQVTRRSGKSLDYYSAKLFGDHGNKLGYVKDMGQWEAAEGSIIRAAFKAVTGQEIPVEVIR